MNSQTNISVRGSAVAGRFFPHDPEALARSVADCLAQSGTAASVPKAVISPHAGYAFSGRLAGAAWGATRGFAGARVVVLSPSHRHGFEGVALPSQGRYAMPGFEVAIDAQACERLVARGLAHVEDAAHDHEHGVETQLPFAHHTHPDAKVVALVIGRARPGQVAKIVDALAGMGETPPLFVLSSDLSHFLTRAAAERHDAETARLVETGVPDGLTGAHACGAAAIGGFMTSGVGRGLRVQRLGMANSADVTQDAARTVGYGAWAFHGQGDAMLLLAHRAALLRAARRALVSRVTKGRPPKLDPATFAPPLQGHGAAFVTLRKAGRLRGCIGSLKARQPLVGDVVENTLKAATQDPRFAAVTAAELDAITLRIAVLSPAAPMSFADERDLLGQLRPGRDGLIMTDSGRRGVFLPAVWESLPEPRDFLSALRRKAGLAEDHWSSTLRVERFRAESFGEDG